MDKTDKIKERFLSEINSCGKLLYKICSLYTNSREEYKDLEQEILLNLWKSYPSFKNQSSFSTLMYRIAFNIAILNLRQKKKYTTYHSIDDDMPDSTPNLVCDENYRLLHESIKELPQIDRAIIMLFYCCVFNPALNIVSLANLFSSMN